MLTRGTMVGWHFLRQREHFKRPCSSLSLSLSLSPPVSKYGVEDSLKKHLNAVLPFVVVGARNNLFHQET